MYPYFGKNVPYSSKNVPYSGKNVPIFLECAHIGRMYPYSKFGCTHILTHLTHILECTHILVRMSHILRMCPYSRNRRIEYAHILECAHILGIAEYNDTYSVNARYSIFGQDDMAQALTTAHSR
jgi:hypothetical protein